MVPLEGISFFSELTAELFGLTGTGSSLKSVSIVESNRLNKPCMAVGGTLTRGWLGFCAALRALGLNFSPLTGDLGGIFSSLPACFSVLGFIVVVVVVVVVVTLNFGTGLVVAAVIGLAVVVVSTFFAGLAVVVVTVFFGGVATGAATFLAGVAAVVATTFGVAAALGFGVVGLTVVLGLFVVFISGFLVVELVADFGVAVVGFSMDWVVFECKCLTWKVSGVPRFSLGSALLTTGSRFDMTGTIFGL